MKSSEMKGLPGELLNGIAPGTIESHNDNIAFQTGGSNLASGDASRQARMAKYLRDLPAPGEGLHPDLLGAANHCRSARLSQAQAFNAIRNSIKEGNRDVPDKEICTAIEKAYSESVDNSPYRLTRKSSGKKQIKRSAAEKDKAFQAAIAAQPTCSEEDVLTISPIPIPKDPLEHSKLLLKELYSPQYILGTGLTEDMHLSSVEDILEELRNSNDLAALLNSNPFIIPNPFTGNMGKTRDGKKWSKRCDSCIKALLFAIAEFDNKSLAEQLRFWMRMIQAGIPVAALIHSGNKSIHAWIAVYCADAAEWNAKVKRQLFAETLELFGVDPATKNPSRASRLPGARRNGGEFQRLLYLNPQAGRSA